MSSPFRRLKTMTGAARGRPCYGRRPGRHRVATGIGTGIDRHQCAWPRCRAGGLLWRRMPVLGDTLFGHGCDKLCTGTLQVLFHDAQFPGLVKVRHDPRVKQYISLMLF